MTRFLQGILPGVLLPPLGFVLLALFAALLAWRRAALGAAVIAAAMLGVLALATPMAAGWLVASLEAGVRREPQAPAPQAIVILSAELARGTALEPGALSLERVRAGARLHRQTGLPVLVSGGPMRAGEPSLAEILGRSLSEDFGIAPRWLEQRSRDTRENADFSAAMLREAGIGAAYVVTHGWHLARAQEAFARQHFTAVPAPVRLDRAPAGRASDWLPQPDHLARSWYAMREWVGRLAYRLRDGPG